MSSSVVSSNDKRLPDVARACVIALGAQLQTLKAQFDRMIGAWHRSSETSRRLDVIPGVGPALATALVASIADPKAFRSGRDFSAWIGLVPKQNSSGGKDRLPPLTALALYLPRARGWAVRCLLDLLGPPGRGSGNSLFSELLFGRFWFGAMMELGRLGRPMMVMMSASPGRGGGDGGAGAERSELRGHRQSIGKFRSTEGGATACSLSAISAGALAVFIP